MTEAARSIKDVCSEWNKVQGGIIGTCAKKGASENLVFPLKSDGHSANPPARSEAPKSTEKVIPERASSPDPYVNPGAEVVEEHKSSGSGYKPRFTKQTRKAPAQPQVAPLPKGPKAHKISDEKAAQKAAEEAAAKAEEQAWRKKED